MLLVLWSTGLISLWTKGIVYSTDNSNWSGHKITEEYSVSIDLSNLQNNVGKELYNDGIHRIYVSHVDNTGDENTGGYTITFRSVGDFSLDGASLISGVQHMKHGENQFTYDMSAEMTADYKGLSYDSSVYGLTALNYKDGDAFSFYIFPADAYKTKEVTLKEKEVVHLTLTNLYKNIWIKK